jgi:hypothetical protein
MIDYQCFPQIDHLKLGISYQQKLKTFLYRLYLHIAIFWPDNFRIVMKSGLGVELKKVFAGPE